MQDDNIDTDDSKSIFSSKLNILGAALVAGPMIDPVKDFALQAVQLLPEPYRPLAVSAVGLVVIVLRTFFTKRPTTMAIGR